MRILYFVLALLLFSCSNAIQDDYGAIIIEGTEAEFESSKTVYPKNNILVTTDTHIWKKGDGVHRWNRLAAVGADSAAAWGAITGILTDQADLNDSMSAKASKAALATKVNASGGTIGGPFIFSDPNNRSKLILTKYPSGTGHSNAPTAFDLSSVYLHLGGTEYATNSYRLIGFGYRHSGDQSHAPAVLGYQEINTSSNDYGRLLFATRSTNSDVAPTVRMTVEPNGQLLAGVGYSPATDSSLITKKFLDAAVAGISGDAANLGVPASQTSKDVYLSASSAVIQLISTVAGDVVVHLPDSASISPGRRFIIKRVTDGGSGINIVSGDDNGLIDGTLDIGISAQYSFREVVFDGKTWQIIANYGD